MTGTREETYSQTRTRMMTPLVAGWRVVIEARDIDDVKTSRSYPCAALAEVEMWRCARFDWP